MRAGSLDRGGEGASTSEARTRNHCVGVGHVSLPRAQKQTRHPCGGTRSAYSTGRQRIHLLRVLTNVLGAGILHSVTAFGSFTEEEVYVFLCGALDGFVRRLSPPLLIFCIFSGFFLFLGMLCSFYDGLYTRYTPGGASTVCVAILKPTPSIPPVVI